MSFGCGNNLCWEEQRGRRTHAARSRHPHRDSCIASRHPCLQQPVALSSDDPFSIHLPHDQVMCAGQKARNVTRPGLRSAMAGHTDDDDRQRQAEEYLQYTDYCGTTGYCHPLSITPQSSWPLLMFSRCAKAPRAGETAEDVTDRNRNWYHGDDALVTVDYAGNSHHPCSGRTCECVALTLKSCAVSEP